MYGFKRSDVRLGAVHRFALFEKPDDGIVGTSMFVQENLERGHARVVTGLEYLDRWGQSSLSYYLPVTDWRPGRYGYEERAIEGMELSYSADLTSTIGINIAAGRWESRDGSGEWTNEGRLIIGWQPHPWFELRGRSNNVGVGNDSMALHAALTVPLGGGNRSLPRWEGFGRRDLGLTVPDQETLWNSVTTVGRIEVAERRSSSLSGTDDNTGDRIPTPPTLPEMWEWSQDDVLSPSNEEG